MIKDGYAASPPTTGQTVGPGQTRLAGARLRRGHLARTVSGS
jgi:hypothetical protein